MTKKYLITALYELRDELLTSHDNSLNTCSYAKTKFKIARWAIWRDSLPPVVVEQKLLSVIEACDLSLDLGMSDFLRSDAFDENQDPTPRKFAPL